MTLPSTTLGDLERRDQDLRGLWARRGLLALLALTVTAGLVGLLGVRTATVDAEGSGWELELEYPSVARAGLDVPVTATVRRAGGLGEKVTLAITGTYLDLYETQGFNPEPDATSRDGDLLYLTFEAPPEGDTLVVTYDAYIQPAAQSGDGGELSVIDGGRPVVTVDFDTRIWP
ncbi:hypothetical protein [Nocardioides sp.]|uniref:hypothetical protein n=1 Tax=Nocardioides sp. TaxID=35761 RepID=UPI001A2DA825|nr:hypothetical protein [Nocardioides sp.]MBJ7356797.1 hypothetical protein [Nocardioides sp.]